MQLSDQELEKIKKLARQWGEIISEEAYGPENQAYHWANQK